MADIRPTESCTIRSRQKCGRIQGTNLFWQHKTQADKERNMRILIRMCANLMPFVLPSGAFAADYKITVTIQSGAVSYMHSENAGGNMHGNKGHQLVHKDRSEERRVGKECRS